MKPGKKIIKYLLLLLSAWFLTHCLLIAIDGMTDDPETSDIAVVMGNKVNEDGTLSERLKARLDCASELLKNKKTKRILVSGGLGKEGFYEGDKMKKYLVEMGIADSLIITDNAGNNTEATVENTLKLQNQLKFKSITVVSQFFHISRSKKLFRKKGLKAVHGASPSYYEWRDLYSISREFFAFYFG